MNVAVVSIGRLEKLHASRLEDVVAVEEPLEIRLGGKSLTITMRTPGNDAELAAAFFCPRASSITLHKSVPSALPTT